MITLKQIALLLAACLLACPELSLAGVPLEPLYPDMFPYVDKDAQGSFVTLQNWQLQGNEIRFNTLFANQGDGVFEIRPGDPVSADRYELFQRVYINNDYTGNPQDVYQDIFIGTAPIPGSPGLPPISLPNNAIWFEDFSRFSLHEALVIDDVMAVGSEVAGNTKMSWRLSPNTGPLPGYQGFPSNGSGNLASAQRIGVGWADLYTSGNTGQFVDITGVPVGPLYWLRQTVDPENRITETDETNNSFEVLIDLNHPGEAILFAGEYGGFVQPGGPPPVTLGDVTGDGQLTVEDWTSFKASSETNLDGLSEADAYALGDLNLDGRHSLADAALFRQYYDTVYGEGAFAAIDSVPEPRSVLLVGISAAAICYIGRRQLYRARRALLIGLTITTFVMASSPQQVLAGSPSLDVNRATGELRILNGVALTGYEVLGPPGSLAVEPWLETNLDARNVGSVITADFNNDHTVNIGDYTRWRDHEGGSDVGDADGDNLTGPNDYQEWKAQFGDEIAEGQSWDVIAASDVRLSEFFLGGQTTEASLSIGWGYNTLADLGNLQFYYSTLDDLEVEGNVIYTGGAAAVSSTPLPEPGSVWLIAALLLATACLRRTHGE